MKLKEKKTYNKPPGTILQNMYIKQRLKLLKKKASSFIECGSGNGNISNILLKNGFYGTGFDLSAEACKFNQKINKEYVDAGKYRAENLDFFDADINEKVDLIISSHVIEHLPDDLLKEYFIKCRKLLNDGGRIISLVPANMKHWGIEDETVGHYRRFEFNDFEKIASDNDFKIVDIAGLTYPVSNILLGLSNYLISRKESWKKDFSKEEQTLLSSSGGTKVVKYKTDFPYWFKYVMNEITMYPLFLLQVCFKKKQKLYSDIL